MACCSHCPCSVFLSCLLESRLPVESTEVLRGRKDGCVNFPSQNRSCSSRCWRSIHNHGDNKLDLTENSPLCPFYRHTTWTRLWPWRRRWSLTGSALVNWAWQEHQPNVCGKMNLIKTMCQVQLIIKSQFNKGCCRGDSWKDETSIVLYTLGVRCTYVSRVGLLCNTFSAYLDSDLQ